MNKKSMDLHAKQDFKETEIIRVLSPISRQYLRKDLNQKVYAEIKEDLINENKWDDVAEERKSYDDYWLIEIARLYLQLSSLPRLNDSQAKCMLKILELAEFDDALNYWINEVDERTFSELKIVNQNFQIDEKTILQFEEDTWKHFQTLQSIKNLI
ncbi:hypothetical protein NIES4106_60760 (plasmid) [Fischerella sp. NIES-4106]|nr:hypothetical protein NIES4106_60760 [Fischerella sp. NIES-4106]